MKAKRCATPKALPTSRQWWKDGVAPEAEPPISPSRRRTMVRHASADRQRQYAAGSQPLAVFDELVACRRRTTATNTTVRVPRWAIDAAIHEVLLRMTLDRRPGQNASLWRKAIMESTHRIRYDAVQWAEREGFVGQVKWQAAVAYCGEPVQTVKAIQQSHARIVKTPSFGQLSAQYVADSSGPKSTMERRKEAKMLKEALNKIVWKQAASQG
jgi:hypothetical protein